MNLGLIFSKAGNAMKGVAGSGALLAKKHAPELLIGSGVAGFIVTIIETVKATNKTNEILEHKEDRLERIEDARKNDSPEYSLADYKADISSTNRQTRWELVKAWGPVVSTGGVSIAMLLGGYKILNGRYVATAAAYKVLEASTERYRSNVIEEFGKDVDWRMAHGIKAEELEAMRKEREEKDQEEKKNNKLIRKKPRTAYQNINNQIFDSHSDYWKRYWIPAQVLEWVQGVESRLQSKLMANGHVFLNEAYDMLGMPRTTQGAVLGWINTPRNSHMEKPFKLSLGYANDECPEEEIRRILSSPSNEETWLWITPNCDGVIYQLIDKPFSER